MKAATIDVCHQAILRNQSRGWVSRAMALKLLHGGNFLRAVDESTSGSLFDRSMSSWHVIV
jgi:hypothetical protein